MNEIKWTKTTDEDRQYVLDTFQDLTMEDAGKAEKGTWDASIDLNWANSSSQFLVDFFLNNPAPRTLHLRTGAEYCAAKFAFSRRSIGLLHTLRKTVTRTRQYPLPIASSPLLGAGAWSRSPLPHPHGPRDPRRSTCIRVVLATEAAETGPPDYGRTSLSRWVRSGKPVAYINLRRAKQRSPIAAQKRPSHRQGGAVVDYRRHAGFCSNPHRPGGKGFESPTWRLGGNQFYRALMTVRDSAFRLNSRLTGRLLGGTQRWGAAAIPLGLCRLE